MVSSHLHLPRGTTDPSSVLFTCATITLALRALVVYQQHKADKYQSHCLVVGISFGSLAGVLAKGSVSEKNIRMFLPFGVIIALLCSMIGHAVVRRRAAEKEAYVPRLNEKGEELPASF